MRRHFKALGATAALALALAATPSLAKPGHGHGGYHSGYYPPVQGASFRVDPELAARCGLGAGSIRPANYHPDYEGYDDRYDSRRRDSGIGGALIGGAVGGLVGNRVAGRGDRVIGTVAGAAVGAVAGAAIDRAGDDKRSYDDSWREGGPEYISDECDSVLPPGYRLVSIPGGQECRDEVTTTEEWVPEYVTVPARAPVRDKRTKLRRLK